MVERKKARYLPPILLDRYEQLNGDAIENLEESINIQKALETRLHEQLATGESGDAWRLLNELVPEYEIGDEETKEGVFNRMKHIIHGGIAAYGVRRDIQNIHESQRKLTETLTKCRKDVQETFTMEQWNSMLSELLHIMRMECDAETMRRVAMGIQSRQKLLPSREPIDIGIIAEENKNGTNEHAGVERTPESDRL